MRPISKLFGKDKKSMVVSDAAEPAVTLADFFDAKYYAFAKATKRRSQLDYYVFNKHIRSSLGQKPLREITSEDLDSWVLHQIDAGYKPATEPPPLNRSTAMFRKRRTMNGKQTTKARRDRYKVASS